MAMYYLLTENYNEFLAEWYETGDRHRDLDNESYSAHYVQNFTTFGVWPKEVVVIVCTKIG